MSVMRSKLLPYLFIAAIVLKSPLSVGDEPTVVTPDATYRQDTQLDGNRAAGSSIVARTFNVGTTLGLPHDEDLEDGYTRAEARISDDWYGNGLAWREAIIAVRKLVQAVDPDVVAFQEIFDCRECASIPVTKHKGFICEDWAPGDPNVAQSVLGNDYQIAYHPGKRSKCLAIHKRFGSLIGCSGDDCDDALGGDPIKGCGSGARVARGRVKRRNGDVVTIISIHGTSGFKAADQGCRAKQVERIFVDFGDGKPGVSGNRNLILGDFNTDPGRAASLDISAGRWSDFVGKGKPFQFVSLVGPSAPRSYRGLADIDHIVTDAFRGKCTYRGVGHELPPVWKGVYFDHVPVICTLSE